MGRVRRCERDRRSAAGLGAPASLSSQDRADRDFSAPMKALAAKAPISSGVNGPRPSSSRSALRATPTMRSTHPMIAARTTWATAGVGPACGDQLLQDAHVARGDVVVEIVAGPIPLLRQLESGVAEHGVLTVEQLRVQILEQRQHHPLLGAEVIVDLAQRHAGGCRHIPGRQPCIAVLAQHLLGSLEQRGAGLRLPRQCARHREPCLRLSTNRSAATRDDHIA